MNLPAIFAIASATLRATLRSRIISGALIVALLALAGIYALGTISLGEELRIVRSLGLAMLYFIGLIVAISTGTAHLRQELERKIIVFVLVKPVEKSSIIIGEWLGLTLAVWITVSAAACLYLAMASWQLGAIDIASLAAIILELAEIAIFVALALCFATFASSASATIYAIATLYVGHSLELLRNAGEHAGGILNVITLALYYGLPNLEKYSGRENAVYGTVPSISAACIAIAYAALLIFLLLTLASIIFKRREW